MHAEKAARLSEHTFQLVRNGLVYTRGEKPRAIKSRNIMISQQLCLLTIKLDRETWATVSFEQAKHSGKALRGPARLSSPAQVRLACGRNEFQIDGSWPPLRANHSVARHCQHRKFPGVLVRSLPHSLPQVRQE